MLDVSRLSLSIRGRTILHDIDLSVAPGRVCALIGPNGAGKSTLVKTIAGLHTPTGGDIRVHGTPLATRDRRALARTLCYLPQKTMPVACSVFDAVLLGRKPHIHWRAGAKDRAVAERVLRDMGLAHLAGECVTRISGGEFQKVLIARALAQGAKLLLLDEPINHLDIKNQVAIMELIRTLTREKGLATIIVLHDLNLAVRFADSVLLIRDGRTLYNGTSEDMTHHELSDAYDLPVAIHDIGATRHVLY